MRITQLWRYPVKSLQGERVQQTQVTPQGLAGDRRWALFDRETGLGLTARRAPKLLYAAARLLPDGVAIVLPDGTVADGDAALSEWLGRPVTLRRSDEPGERRYENPLDLEREDAGGWETWAGSGGAFHDSSRTAVSLLSSGTLGDWPPRRFRANVLMDGAGEDAWVGRAITAGQALLDVRKQVDRCVMVTRPQPRANESGDGSDGAGDGALDRDLSVLRTIHRERAGFLAVGATVIRPGTISVGDSVDVTG